jgi:succinate dehydrogenase (ubiquinone) membrane anchor subunit
MSTAIYKGTVNDPTTFPTPSRTHGSYHWAFERILSAGLVPLTGAAFVTSSTAYPVVDALLGVGLVMHSHLGVSPPVCPSVNDFDINCGVVWTNRS